MENNKDDSKVSGGTPGSSPVNAPAASSDSLSEEQKIAKKAELDNEIAEKERRLAGMKAEEETLLKSIVEKRAQRRSEPAPVDETPADNGNPSGGDKKDDEAQSALAKAAEQRAIRNFIKSHPEYVDSKKWDSLIKSYTPRRGKLLWEDVVEDLEDAHLILNKDQVSQEAEKKAKEDLAKKMFSASSGDIGGTSSSSPQASPKTLTEDEKKLLAKLKKVDPTMTEERFIKRKESLMNS